MKEEEELQQMRENFATLAEQLNIIFNKIADEIKRAIQALANFFKPIIAKWREIQAYNSKLIKRKLRTKPHPMSRAQVSRALKHLPNTLQY